MSKIVVFVYGGVVTDVICDDGVHQWMLVDHDTEAIEDIEREYRDVEIDRMEVEAAENYQEKL